jgi:hypothetical protein
MGKQPRVVRVPFDVYHQAVQKQAQILTFEGKRVPLWKLMTMPDEPPKKQGWRMRL